MNEAFRKFDPQTPLIQDWGGNTALAIQQHEALRCWRISLHRWSKATMYTIGAISLITGFQLRNQGWPAWLACVVAGTTLIFLGDYIVRRVHQKKRPTIDEWIKYETDRNTLAEAMGIPPSCVERLPPKKRQELLQRCRRPRKVTIITLPGRDLAIPDSDYEKLQTSRTKFRKHHE